MNRNDLSVLEIYMNRVFRCLMLIIPIIAISAGTTFTVLKWLGFYPSVPAAALAVFDASTLLYLLAGLALFRHCEDKEGNLIPRFVFFGKVFFAVVAFIQWNFITYTIPSSDFWAYGVFFVMLGVFFLDHLFVAIISAEIAGSMLVSVFVYPDFVLPPRDEFFTANVVLRAVLLAFSFATIWAVTFCIQKLLVVELERITDYDTLTLLLNRRMLNHSLNERFEKAQKDGSSFSVLMCDLDDFKQYNDRYGHDCGDVLLREVARTMRLSVNRKGRIFRFGGEELLVLADCGTEEAVDLAEQIRKDVETGQIDYNGEKLFVTMTIGVATYSGGMTDSGALIRCADANLYYGKNHGKNCVVV